MEAAQADGWLVAPSTRFPDINIVRCYRHITVRSLMDSFAGRTDFWLGAMYEGRVRAMAEGPGIPPMAEPFPMEDEVFDGP